MYIAFRAMFFKRTDLGCLVTGIYCHLVNAFFSYTNYFINYMFLVDMARKINEKYSLTMIKDS